MTDRGPVKTKEGSFEDNYEKKQQQEEEKFKKEVRNYLETTKKEKQEIKETETPSYTPKDILDKYRPMIIRKDKIFLKDGEAQVNNHDQEKYTAKTFSS